MGGAAAMPSPDTHYATPSAFGGAHADLHRPTPRAGDPGRLPGERRRFPAPAFAARRSGADAGRHGHVARDPGGDSPGSRAERAVAGSVLGLAPARDARRPRQVDPQQDPGLAVDEPAPAGHSGTGV